MDGNIYRYVYMQGLVYTAQTVLPLGSPAPSSGLQ